ncbi:MAG: sigma-54 dependent transcriptional regulator, partial [Planctomycetota bacterium]|nr:sigma-54 dependent transcriptional regulator [Planctomycetota bacterium]
MLEKNRILVVDDEPGMRKSLSDWLTEDGYEVATVTDGPSALAQVKESAWDVLLVDLKMPGMDGLQVLQEVTRITKDIPVIIITAYATVDTAVSALKNGAYDYLVKPVDPEELSLVIRKVVEHQNLQREVRLLKKELTKQYQFQDIIAKSRPMQEIFQLVQTVSPMASTVLISGESGTGKELIARAIHNSSPRAQAPFIALSLGALPETLQESELFGYEKGAFTGAIAQTKGKLELAQNGTLFLDDIADFAPKAQIDLLRVLQEREFRRLGGQELIKIDVRIIASTNRDLKQSVKEGKFREDLFYRLNVIHIHLPPLRDRKEDIPLLVNHFIRKYNLQTGKKLEGITPPALGCLLEYHWPGNVRELENVIERAVVIAPGIEIKPDDLPKDVCQHPQQQLKGSDNITPFPRPAGRRPAGRG